jgi:Zn-dependent peptidase ImmA (M78 family)
MCRWDARAVFNFFPVIKRSVNDLLGDGDGYAQNPKVDIELLARKNGINDILYVLPEEISEKYPRAHAYIDKERSIIYVNKNDNPEKQRFSIAHELFHSLFILLNKDGNALSVVTRRGDSWKKENAGSDEAEGEDIADFFAANLLVPTERFILWDDKTDDEIAGVFGVEVKCIKKRKEEIEHELRILAPKNLSSDENRDGQALLAADEIKHNVEGHTTHAPGRD